jgi:predicted RNA-binding Zn-ribbon protein involved in translation (DUF1610 family)
MTDYYQLSLNLLLKLLENSGYDNWINWISEDIRLWKTEGTTEHHLRAYGGMGSFNDVVVGNNDEMGLWKSRVFGIVQTLAYSLAKSNIKTAPLEESFYGNESYEISGWRCRNCGNAIINERNIDIYLSTFFVPKFFVKYLKQGNVEEILNIEKLINSAEVLQKKQNVKNVVVANGIAFSSVNDWLWTCPKCGSGEVCSYRWNISKDDSNLHEADDNLAINKS